MEAKFTIRQAFDAMTSFLEAYYNQTYSSQINSLLSDMDMGTWGDGNQTADPALWEDWIECVNTDDVLTIKEAYEAVARFVSMRYALQPDDYVVALIDGMRFLQDGTPVNSNLWSQWVNSISIIMNVYGRKNN